MSEPEDRKRDASLAAVVLCGGRSRRMGYDKASLRIGEQTFLDAVVARVSTVVVASVLVGNQQRGFPPLAREYPDHDIRFVSDEQPDAGPMEGIRVGLESLASEFEFAFVTSCDVPLLVPELIVFLRQFIGNQDAVIPIDRSTGRVFGMTAIYRTSTHREIAAMVERQDLKVSRLAEQLDTRLIEIESLRSVDPKLDSVLNINEVADYHRLLRRLELPIPADFEDSRKWPPESS